MRHRHVMWAMLAGWAAAGLGAPALAGPCTLGILADLPVTMAGTRATVPAKVNGQGTRFWLDSGAFFSFMSQAKAAEFGLHLEPLPIGFTMSGIGGTVTPQLARIKSLGLVGQELRNQEFLVGGSDAGNAFFGRNILGMRDTEFDLANGIVKLIDPHGCAHTDMAYWAGDKPYSTVPLLAGENSNDHSFKLPVIINGTRLEAALDTGAVTSLLTRSAARRAGIDLAAPEVIPTMAEDVGRRYEKGWVVPIANVTIGDEQMLHTHLAVVDDSDGNGHGLPDMLLGEDFIMAHHIYVARGQGLIYFTYSGGKPFRTSRDPALPRIVGSAPAQPPVLPPGTRLAEAVAGNAGNPTTADGYARRGAARLAAQDLPGALADLSEAIRQSPDNAGWYADRARVYARLGNAAAMRGDIDKALTLEPGNAVLLRSRAVQRLAAKDRVGALADAEAAARVTPPASLDSAELAEFFVHLHQPARAIPMYDAVIAAHGEDAKLDDLLHARCWARAIADVELDKALADCNRAIRHGASVNRLQARALVYFRQAKYPLAIADYDAALKINPRLAASLYIRGQAKLALGQSAEGDADQAAAHAIRPNIAEEWAGYGIGAAKAKAS